MDVLITHCTALGNEAQLMHVRRCIQRLIPRTLICFERNRTHVVFVQEQQSQAITIDVRLKRGTRMKRDAVEKISTSLVTYMQKYSLDHFDSNDIEIAVWFTFV